MRTSGKGIAGAALAATLLTLPAALRADPLDLVETAVPPYSTAPGGVSVQLFEWPWPSVALECEAYLGPAGFRGVQVSPPQEHIVLHENRWWTRYQPVSYRLEGRSGTRVQFADMVRRCRAAGVDVYVDVVINHMAGMDRGAGSAGSSFGHYDYPGLYRYQDFHHCGRHGDDDIRNYRDRWEVQNCELVNLADLDTGAGYVRGRIAGYLGDLLGLGVAGFRIDAAKHMPAGEIRAILDAAVALAPETAATPFVYQEVIDLGGEPITSREYLASGAVTEFRYAAELARVFRHGELGWLERFGESRGMLPSQHAVVFSDNHDNQRGHGGGGHVVTYGDGRLYELANLFMLAWPYGQPRLMSSYRFHGPDEGPPLGPGGRSMRVHPEGDGSRCREPWVCEHRWAPMRGGVGLRQVAGAAPVARWWSEGRDRVAFAREGRAYVVLNRSHHALHRRFQTTLPPGTYCDVARGGLRPDGAGCTGDAVAVDAGGWADIGVIPMDARAFHLGSRVSP